MKGAWLGTRLAFIGGHDNASSVIVVHGNMVFILKARWYHKLIAEILWQVKIGRHTDQRG